MASVRALVVLAAALALVLVPGAFAASQSYTVPGTYLFTVPAGVTSIDVVAVGASGGSGISAGTGIGGAGGLGALVQGTLAVSPGETLQVNVGGQGADGGAIGFGFGGGGGGASDVRTGAFTLDDRVVVAGGGGGGGGAASGEVGGAGGDGGGGAGGDCPGGAGMAGGGTQDAGGAGAGDGTAGTFGQGGAGAFGSGAPGGFNGGGTGGALALGGGGGGGWYGGGGGGAALCGGGGGGGGSNHAAAGVTGFSEGLAAGPGDGSVTLTWEEPEPVVVVTGGVAVPPSCDPLIRVCAIQSTQPGAPPLAPPEDGGDSGPAVGQPRMPNLRPSVTATWRDGTIRITVRVHISKPRLVKRPIQVRVRIPALDETRLLRVRANGKHLRTLHLRISGPASAIGKRVIVRLDPNKQILETRRKDNTASARIT